MLGKIFKNKIKKVRELNSKLYEVSYENGDSYRGEFNNSLKIINGEGHYISANSESEYYGSWKLNMMHGDGIKEENGISYKGKFLNGDFVNGSVDYPNKSNYIGAYENGQKHGRGMYKKDDTETYEGEWENDKKHGKGKKIKKSSFHNLNQNEVYLMQSKKTSRYFFVSKSFLSDLHGFGTDVFKYLEPEKNKNFPNMLSTDVSISILPIDWNDLARSEVVAKVGEKAMQNYKNGKLKLLKKNYLQKGEITIEIEGNWNNDLLTKGIEKRKVNKELKWKYKGEFKDEKMHGENGYLEWYNGDSFKGAFKNGHYKRGIYKSLDFIYDGQWSQNNYRGVLSTKNFKLSGRFPTGLGRYENSEMIYEGKILNGKKHGQGELTNKKTGKTIKGKWVHDKLSKN